MANTGPLWRNLPQSGWPWRETRGNNAPSGGGRAKVLLTAVVGHRSQFSCVEQTSKKTRDFFKIKNYKNLTKRFNRIDIAEKRILKTEN